MQRARLQLNDYVKYTDPQCKMMALYAKKENECLTFARTLWENYTLSLKHSQRRWQWQHHWNSTKQDHIFMFIYSQRQPKYKCNFYRKDNLTNKSWSRCLTCPRLDLWPFLDEEDEVDGASSSPTGSVRVAEVGSLMTHWISCRARAVTIWMDSSEFNLHHREIQTCIHWYMYSLIYMHIQKIPQWTHEIHRKNQFTDFYRFSFSDSCEQYEMITKAQGLWFDTKHRNHKIMYIYLRQIWNLQKEMAREPSHWVLNVSIVVTCNS